MAVTHEGLEVLPWKLKPGVDSDGLAIGIERGLDVLKTG